jgi:histone-lysine N-methyltransferase SETMAR
LQAKFSNVYFETCDIITCDESWVYYRQLNHKQNNKTWCYEGQAPRTVVRREQHEPKSLITVYFKSTGMVYVDVMEKNKTIDNRYYIKNSLEPAFKELEKQRPTSGLKNVKLLHDNARPHVHKNVKNFLMKRGITLIQHPPYSSDLAPCDFWLFDKLKTRLKNFLDTQSLKKGIKEAIKCLKKSILKLFKSI